MPDLRDSTMPEALRRAAHVRQNAEIAYMCVSDYEGIGRMPDRQQRSGARLRGCFKSISERSRKVLAANRKRWAGE